MTEQRIKSFWGFFGRVSKSDFKTVKAFKSSSFLFWFGFILLMAVSAFILTFSLQQVPSNLKEGMIASRNIKADRNYEIVDAEASQKFKDEAMASILPIYDMDTRAKDEVVKRIREAFVFARESLAEDGQQKSSQKSVEGLSMEEALADIESGFSERLGITLAPAQISVLFAERFSEKIEGSISNIVGRVMSRPIIAERATLDAEKAKGIVLRKVIVASPQTKDLRYEEKILENTSGMISTEEARRIVGTIAVATSGFKSKAAPATVTALAQLLIEPNCSLNRTETERRQVEASANVKNVVIKINAGEMIIREGSRFEPWHIKVLGEIKKEMNRGIYSFHFIGTFFLILLILSIPFYLVERYYPRVSVSRSDYVLLSVVGLIVLIFIRISLVVIPPLRDALFFSTSSTFLNYAIPVAGGAMLVRMFLGAEVATIFAVILSVLAAFIVDVNVQYILYCMISSFAAIAAIADVDKRSRILKAGAITGIINALVVITIRIVDVGIASQMVTLSDILWSVLFAFAGGIGASVFAMIAASIIDSFSSYTSDIKLLELANLNHPLLRELIVRAPGTYHHSHMVGILGEAAAEAIDAKALLVRVGAYYHDIGKMKKPLYFIENAKSGENKHDKLSAHMSALIIAAHVKDGQEMAQKAKLPKSINEIIPQHHGTRLIGYFFDKAKESEDESVQKVDMKEFMYPGPKPQTREAAILMLSDAVEAAVRALKEKSSTRIQQTVQRVITDIFTEKQLDECDLTLRDLNQIAKAFIRILLGIYHARIEYPKDNEPEKPEMSIIEEASSDTSTKEPKQKG